MKKFMIFLLMAFLYLGTCQARSEATHLNGANDKLHSWVTPSTLFGSPSDMHMSAGDVPPGTPIHKISPSQPQNLCLNCDHNQVIFVSNWNANGYTRPTVLVRRWYVNDMPTDSLGETFQERLPTPAFWPGEFHGLDSPWGHKESDMTEWFSLSDK